MKVYNKYKTEQYKTEREIVEPRQTENESYCANVCAESVENDCIDECCDQENCRCAENIIGNTGREFEVVINECREIFRKKLGDYGASWRIMRPESVTDQIYIKANRIRSLQEKGGKTAVGEGIQPEFMAIVNYGIIGLIQIALGYSKKGNDLLVEEAMDLYDEYVDISYNLMTNKNQDYDEAWRLMRMNSYTDLILTKLFRIMQIEENCGKVQVSEGIDANYLDIINYAVFALIKFYENKTFNI